MRLRHHVALALTFVFSTALVARAERLPIKVYTTTDGLPHDTVNRIVKDSRGFLWFCTAAGLARFDGYTFRTFGPEHGLPHQSVSDFLETRAGVYFVATRGGLARFEPGGSPRFVPIPPPAVPAAAAQITGLREGRDGTIWVGTNDGLYRLEGGTSLRPVDVGIPREYAEQREVTNVMEDARASVWISTRNGLYRRWPDGSATRYTKADGLPTDYISGVFEDRERQLWVTTQNHGFFRMTADATHRAPVMDPPFERIQGVPVNWVFQLFQASDGRYWVAMANGLAEFFPNGDVTGRRFRSYADRSGVTDFQIISVAEDSAGNLWLGTGSSGAMKVTRGGFATYGTPDGIRSVHAVFEDDRGNVCFRGTVLGDGGRTVFEGASLSGPNGDELWLHVRFGCFDGKRFEWFYPPGITNFGWVNQGITLRTRNGEWWVGTADGVYRYAPMTHLPRMKTARPIAIYGTQDGLPGPQVFRLFEDSRARVWIATTSPTTHGLARWDRETGQLEDLTRLPGLPSMKDDVPRAFAEDKEGNIWMGFEGGLVRYRDGAVSFFAAGDRLPRGAVRHILVDRTARVWLASAQSGLIRIDDGSGDRPTFSSYTTVQGLSSNTIDVLAEDEYGHLFVAGGRGLDRLDPATGRIRHFTKADGVPPGQFQSAFRQRDGALWFGTTLGVARFVPERDVAAPPPPVWITRLRVRGEAQLVSALGEREMALPDLSPQQNQLEVEFVGLSFLAGDALRYQYKLEGADADWSAPDAQRTVTFARLAPGQYRFVVRAVNSNGIESDSPAVLAFTILHPFWQRAWFTALIAAAAALALHRLYRYRVARLLEMANMRTRIATDLHDDVGANLTRIVLLSELARQPPTGAGAGRASLREVLEERREDTRLLSIASIARESVSAMSDIVWAVNPRRESLLDLVRRMRQHADELFTLRGIELRFTAPEGADSLRLGVDIRRDVLLIFKEAVSNAARHSRCSIVSVHLRREGRRLRLTVADNGIGFNQSAESDGNGCLSMQRRAQRLHGTLEITSAHNVGTTVMVSIPI
jgi:signal transduction histidine kinase/ligand-binding sensor domain-containing protein